MLQEILHGSCAVSNHIMLTKMMSGEVGSIGFSVPSSCAEQRWPTWAILFLVPPVLPVLLWLISIEAYSFYSMSLHKLEMSGTDACT